MTPDEIFDTYMLALLTGVGSRLADGAISGTALQPTAIAAMIATAGQAARQAYDSRDDYRPDAPPQEPT